MTTMAQRLTSSTEAGLELFAWQQSSLLAVASLIQLGMLLTIPVLGELAIERGIVNALTTFIWWKANVF